MPRRLGLDNDETLVGAVYVSCPGQSIGREGAVLTDVPRRYHPVRLLIRGMPINGVEAIFFPWTHGRVTRDLFMEVPC